MPRLFSYAFLVAGDRFDHTWWDHPSQQGCGPEDCESVRQGGLQWRQDR